MKPDDDIPDGPEVWVYETDPHDPDSDNDRYYDGTEVLDGTDPNDPDDHPDGPPDYDTPAPPQQEDIVIPEMFPGAVY